MTTDLHAHASLITSGTADMLEHGRPNRATDDLRIAAVLTRDGARLTVEVERPPDTDDGDDLGLTVEFVGHVDATKLARFGRMLVAMSDGQQAAEPPSDAAEERDEYRSLVEYMLRAVGYSGEPHIGTQESLRLVFDDHLKRRAASYREHSIALSTVDMLLRGEPGVAEPWPDGAAVTPVLDRAGIVVEALQAASHAMTRVRSVQSKPAGGVVFGEWHDGDNLPDIGMSIEVEIDTGETLRGVVGELSPDIGGVRIDGPRVWPVDHRGRGTEARWWTWTPGQVVDAPPTEERRRWREVKVQP